MIDFTPVNDSQGTEGVSHLPSLLPLHSGAFRRRQAREESDVSGPQVHAGVMCSGGA